MKWLIRIADGEDAGRTHELPVVSRMHRTISS
jgi:hypothetical protein